MGLEISPKVTSASPFPTSSIARGWLLLNDGKDLSEEAVGFGVPIIKRGLQAIFPGEIELFLGGGGDQCKFTARYTLNLVEKISHSAGTINNPLVTNTKNLFAGMIRQFPAFRRQLTGISSLMRKQLGWQTSYGTADFCGHITMDYTINPSTGKLVVEMTDKDFTAEQVSEIIIMSEQGAHYFDRYWGDDGSTLLGEDIGCWDEVSAERAEFISSSQKLSFSLRQVKAAILYRGRELIGDRLAWSGFGYSFSPKLDYFKYQIIIRRLE
jgi:hypothetical protein